MEFTLVETILYGAVMLWLCGDALSSRHLSVPAKTSRVFLLGAVLCWSGLATLLQIPVDEHTGQRIMGSPGQLCPYIGPDQYCNEGGGWIKK